MLLVQNFVTHVLSECSMSSLVFKPFFHIPIYIIYLIIKWPLSGCEMTILQSVSLIPSLSMATAMGALLRMKSASTESL
jgi:hypothetical protein